VSSVVIENEMEIKVGWHVAIDGVEKARELLGAMTTMQLAQHATAGDIEESLPPFTGRGQGSVQPTSDCGIAVLRGVQQYDASTPSQRCAVLGRRVHSISCACSDSLSFSGARGRPVGIRVFPVYIGRRKDCNLFKLPQTRDVRSSE